MKWLALVVAAGALAALPRAARAEPAGAVALLPLDADAKLEIYGQPVASELARALVGGGVDVVVVGPRMAVPTRAVLVVDGKISGGKGDAVHLALRIRDRESGTVLDTVPADAPALTSIDEAAADLSARMLPKVRALLAARAADKADKPVRPPPIETPSRPPPPRPRPFAIAVTATGAHTDELQPALQLATAAWARARHREPQVGGTPAPTAPDLALDITGYRVEPGAVPLAHARVHAVLRDATHVVFDRVIVTDTIVGDRGAPATRTAERVAREVLAILSPNAARAVPELRAP